MAFMQLNNPISDNEKINMLIQLMYSPIYTIEVPDAIISDMEDLAMDYSLKFSNLPITEFYNEVKRVRDAGFKNLDPKVFNNDAKDAGNFEVCMRIFTEEYTSFVSDDKFIPAEDFPREFTPKWDKIKLIKELINEVPELVDEFPNILEFRKLDEFSKD